MDEQQRDPAAVLRHWRVEVNFEAWNEADAERLVARMMRPLDEEQRLLFVSSPPVETFDLRG